MVNVSSVHFLLGCLRIDDPATAGQGGQDTSNMPVWWFLRCGPGPRPHLGSCWKYRFLGPTQTHNHWGRAQPCVVMSPPGDGVAQPSSRTTALAQAWAHGSPRPLPQSWMGS